jgi:hypothetical protein
MHPFSGHRWAPIVPLVLLVVSVVIASLSIRDNRVLASRPSLAAVAGRYPIGSRERSIGVRAEILRRRHANWRDLSLSEVADKVAYFTNQLLRPMDTTNPSANTPPLAPFLGNFTTIGAPYPQEFALTRESDCSLTLNTGTYSFNLSTPGYSITNRSTHFDQTLHSESLLTTKGGTFPAGCTPVNGSSTRAVLLGKTSQNLYVIAIAGYDPRVGENALYYGTIDSSFNYHSFSVDDSNPKIQRVIGGDLNHDGNGDIIELNLAGTVTVLLGNADGTFSSPVTYATAGQVVNGGVVDDFNGDGKLDVAVVSNDRQLSILYGKGDGTLSAAQSLPIVTPPDAAVQNNHPIENIITADLRGIGRRDIITSDGVVLLANGDGTFTTAPKSAFPASNSTSDFGPNLVAADLNKDGKIDVVLSDGASINVYLGNGDGSFVPRQGYASINSVGYVTVVDLDGDGNADIYVGAAGGPIFGGDQFAYDLSYALLGNGDGTFQGASVIKQDYTGTNLADVSGDGHKDLVGYSTKIDSSGNFVIVSFTTYLGQKDGSFASTGPVLSVSNISVGGKNYTLNTINTLALADVNGDGRADLLFIPDTETTFNERDILVVALGKADGSFGSPTATELPSLLTNPVTLPTGGPDFDFNLVAGSLHLADLNGDGKLDLFYSYQDSDYSTSTISSGFVFQPGNGDGTFGAPKTLQTYSGASISYTLPQFALFADVNNDGKPDLITIQQTGSTSSGVTTQVFLNLNKGDGSFAPSSILQLGDQVSVPILGPSIVAADLNHDGNIDLISLGADAKQNGSIAISLGHGDGTFASATKLAVQDGDVISTDGLAIGDFNGDGKPDIAITSFIPGSSGIYFGKGDGTILPFLDSSGTAHPSEIINLSTFGAATAEDFDGDGKTDLLSTNVVFRSVSNAVTAPPSLSASTTSLTASPATITLGSQVTLTATVAGPSGNTTVPTGSVTFLDGTTPISSVTLDASGKATFSITTLTAGAHNISANYAGDSTFANSVSTTVPVTVTVPAMDFSLSSTASSGTVSVGAPATATLTVTSVNGFTGSVSFTCTGLPSGVSCAFNPAAITPVAGKTITTAVTFTKSATAAASRSALSIFPIITGLLSLGLFRKRRSNTIRLVVACGSIACALSLLSGCSGHSSSTGTISTANVTITATSGTLSHNIPFTLSAK